MINDFFDPLTRPTISSIIQTSSSKLYKISAMKILCTCKLLPLKV